MTARTALDKLRILLPHWIDHNRRHGEEFRQWAETARADELATPARHLADAADAIRAADAQLREAAHAIGVDPDKAAHTHAHTHDHAHDHAHTD